MNFNEKNKNCPICSGNKVFGKTIFTANLGFGIIVVKDVPATLCSQCGAEWIADDISEKLEKIVNEARARKSSLELTSLSA